MNAPHSRHPDDGDGPAHHLLDAAIAAEMDTGRREETLEQAKAHLLIRIGRVLAGAVLVVIGAAMLVLPGPGLLLVAGGLSLLAVDVPFARRLRDALADQAGRATRRVSPRVRTAVVAGGVLAGVGASVLLLVR